MGDLDTIDRVMGELAPYNPTLKPDEWMSSILKVVKRSLVESDKDKAVVKEITEILGVNFIVVNIYNQTPLDELKLDSLGSDRVNQTLTRIRELRDNLPINFGELISLIWRTLPSDIVTEVQRNI